MRLRLVRTGGFGGLVQAAAADEDALAPEELAELRRLVADADPWSLPPELSPPSPGPDRLRYRLTVEDGSRRREIRVAEEALPDRLRPLVRWLEQRLRPGGRTGA
jgi:hypothetical protein